MSNDSSSAKLKALILTGQMNPHHHWPVSCRIFKKLLEDTGLFKADIVISPPRSRHDLSSFINGIITWSKRSGSYSGHALPGSEMEKFEPNFADYDVVVLDYEGESWSEKTNKAFDDYVKSGGGVVVVHAAGCAFPQWKEYNEMMGLSGWRGRDASAGPMVRWRDGKMVLDDSPGPAGTHPPDHEFQVITRAPDHPIMKGLPEKWMHGEDELYMHLRGPAKNLTVLATAYADPNLHYSVLGWRGTGEHEPVIFSVNYGKGRVFYTTFGDTRTPPLTSVECVGFIVTYQRGAEWAATGNVTQEIPDDFPTATEVRQRHGCYKEITDKYHKKNATDVLIDSIEIFLARKK